MYAIKFYLKSHKDSKKRYNLLVNDGDAFRVLSTCLNIIIDILEKQPFASFGFIGAPTSEEQAKQIEVNNKRFRVYRQIAQNRFSTKHFEHAMNSEKSTYIILNKQNKESKLLTKIETMFKQCYEGL